MVNGQWLVINDWGTQMTRIKRGFLFVEKLFQSLELWKSY
jgi:hypothetical protein